MNRIEDLSITATHCQATNPKAPSNFLAQSHQHVTNNFKYIQYNQTFCSQNKLQILWTVSMLLLLQFMSWVLSDYVSVNLISSRLNLHLGLHGSFLWTQILCNNRMAIITYLMLHSLQVHFL